MGVILTPILSATAGTPQAYNEGIAEAYSWVPTVGAALGRPMYAKASYITNFSDMSIYLSASELSIGAVTLKDNNSGLNADVVAIPDYGAGLQVLTQDLESTIDDVTIGDKQGNFASVDPLLSALNIKVTNPAPVVYADSANLDPFGRLRVSTPYTLLDSKNVYSKNIFAFDEILSGTAVAQFSAFDSCVDFKTSDQNSYIIRQTRKRFNYSPGKGLISMFTGVFAPQADIIKRVGMFQSLTAAPYEPSDGIFLEVNGNGPVLRIVKSQGSPHTLYTPQSAWNVDKFDGFGPSGKTIDFTKAILFVIDYQWLSIGRVRFGFEVDGQLFYAHQNGHAGELTAPYMTYSNQPVRYEMRQLGTNPGFMRQICSTVMIEGGQEHTGREFNTEDGLVTVANGVYTPLLALKLNPATPNISNIVKQIDVVNIGSKPAHYALFINPRITGGTFTFGSIQSNTTMLTAGGTNTISITEGVSGYRVVGGLCAVGQVGQSAPTASKEVYGELATFGCGIRGDTDVIVLAAKGLGGTTELYASINLLEKG